MRTRAACDRCHQQKLRCTRAEGQASCNRCLRLGAICHYSPSMRGVRRHQTQVPIRNLGTPSASPPSGPQCPTENPLEILDPAYGQWDSALVPRGNEILDPTSYQWDSGLISSGNSLVASDNRTPPSLTSDGNHPINFTAVPCPTYGALGASTFSVLHSVTTDNWGTVAAASGSPGPWEASTSLSPTQTNPPNSIATVLGLERMINELSERLCENAEKSGTVAIWATILRNNYKQHMGRPGRLPPPPSALLDATGVHIFFFLDSLALTETTIEMGKRFTSTLEQHRLRHETTSSSPSSGLTLSSLLLLLSCHNRVFDTWATSFSKARSVERAFGEDAAIAEGADTRYVPRLRPECFSPTMLTTANLFLSVIDGITGDLVGSLIALIDELSTPFAPGSSGRLTPNPSTPNTDTNGAVDDTVRSPIAVPLCRSVLARAVIMYNTAMDIKSSIEHLMVNSGLRSPPQ